MLERDPPYGAKVTFELEKASHRLERAGAGAVARAGDRRRVSREFFGKPAMYMGEGGTIPFMGMLGEKFPDAQFMITGVLGPHSNAHGPNEFLHIPTGKRVTACVARVIADHHEASQRGETPACGVAGGAHGDTAAAEPDTARPPAALNDGPIIVQFPRRRLATAPGGSGRSCGILVAERSRSSSAERGRLAAGRQLALALLPSRPSPRGSRRLACLAGMHGRHASSPRHPARVGDTMFDGLLMYIVGGAVIGILARFFKPGADRVGWIMTILLGATGATGRQLHRGHARRDGPWLVWVIAILARSCCCSCGKPSAAGSRADCADLPRRPASAGRGLGAGFVVPPSSRRTTRSASASADVGRRCPGAIPALPALRTASRCR